MIIMLSESSWKDYVKGETLEWLLEEENPSVRYFTLTGLLDRAQSDDDVAEAKAEIMEHGVVPSILSKQEEEGFWGEPKRVYHAKYKGTVWQLLILAELGADGGDKRIRNACEFILENSQDRESGGFSMHSNAKEGGGRHNEVIPCLTGNIVWSLLRFGYVDDPRVQRGIDFITRHQRFDDGIDDPPTGWPYDRATMCFSGHTCHMGAVKALKALSAIPPDRRTDAVNTTIEDGVEYMLIHHIHKRSHDLSKFSKPGWRRFGFPLMYQTNVLEILDILTGLGYRDERMQEAIDLVISAQDERGRWLMQNTFNGKFLVDIEKKNEPSKWVTLKALTVLKRLS